MEWSACAPESGKGQLTHRHWTLKSAGSPFWMSLKYVCLQFRGLSQGGMKQWYQRRKTAIGVTSERAARRLVCVLTASERLRTLGRDQKWLHWMDPQDNPYCRGLLEFRELGQQLDRVWSRFRQPRRGFRIEPGDSTISYVICDISRDGGVNTHKLGKPHQLLLN